MVCGKIKMNKLFFGAFLIFAMISFVSAVDCPLGIVNDSYPGDCGKYIDSNKDKICDLSQEANVLTPSENLVLPKSDVSVKDVDYYFIPIILVVSLLYFLTFYLVKTKKISLMVHRKIWNFALLISFIILAILSVLLVLRIQYNISVLNEWRNFMLFWHVELGIIFCVISLFHILWHLAYYKNLLKN